MFSRLNCRNDTKSHNASQIRCLVSQSIFCAVSTSYQMDSHPQVFGKTRKLLGKASFSEWFFNLNSLSASPTKWSSRLKQFVGYCWRIVWLWPRMLKSLAKLSNILGVTDHFVGLALRGLKGCILSQRFTRNFFENFHNAWPSRYLSVESQQSKHQKNVWIILCSKLTIKTP